MTEKFVIQSDTALLPDIEERLFHFCHECNVGNYYAAVSVAALQAVENAIIHGNGADVSKKVDIICGTCRGGIFVEVADEGSGFDFSQYGELPLDDATAGEGIFMMKTLADKMDYSDGGRRVRMEFVIAGIDPAEAMERVDILQSRFALVEA